MALGSVAQRLDRLGREVSDVDVRHGGHDIELISRRAVERQISRTATAAVDERCPMLVEVEGTPPPEYPQYPPPPLDEDDKWVSRLSRC
jgi:hypothetical protein